MGPLKTLREYIKKTRDAGLTLEQVATTRDIINKLRKQLKLAPGEPVVVDGVPIVEYSRRDNALMLARGYANLRWDVNMTPTDVESLFKAVSDDEIEGLVAIIVDQHMDMHGIQDPVESLDEQSVRELREELAEMGFTDVSF